MSAVNIEQARHNMIEQQVRPWDVLDTRTLNLMDALPRDAFVPEAYKNLAYADTAIPLGHGEDMMHPNVEARMLQALNVQPTDNVLEVGTGSGYITACLAQLSAHVNSVEIHEDLSQQAAERLVEQGILNVSLYVGDATDTSKLTTQYAVIAITGSLPEVPDDYKQALSVGGRMFVITGEDPVMVARLITRTSEDSWAEQYLFETSLKPLVHSEKAKIFEF